MHPSPRLLGALAVVLVAGVSGGALLGAVPPMKQVSVIALIPPERLATYYEPGSDGPLPDHYPLETRTGRFEVHQLAERGLFSQARYAATLASIERAYGEPAYAGYEVAEADAPTVVHPAAMPEPAPLVIYDATESAPQADPPRELAAADAPPARPGGPRVIDVAAELAARH